MSEELEELRRNENQLQGHEQNNDEINPTIEVDEINHIGRIPRRVNEWLALIDHNRERESQGLEPIYPWGSHFELSDVIEVDNEASRTHALDIARSLSHLSLEDGNLIQVHDNSLSWQEDALINDAPEGYFNLNNIAIFKTPSATPNNA